MPAETLFEFEQTFARADVAAYLREIADTLDGDGTLEFTAGGQTTTVSVPDRLQFDVDVERSPKTDGSTEMEIEFELEWREGEDGTAPGELKIG
jgi:amphi-Trp domain-containing protein